MKTHRAFASRGFGVYIKSTALTDEKLWNYMRAGDKKAFDFIYLEYIRKLYTYGAGFTKDTSIIEDCIQDLFIEIWEKRHLLSATNSIKFYLFRSLRRRIARCLTTEKKLIEKLINQSDISFEIVLSPEQTLINEQLQEEQIKQLLLAIKTLSKRQKEAVFLKYYGGFSYDEISAIMTIHTNAVYKLTCTAIAKLRETVKKDTLLLFLFFLINRC